MASRQLYSVWGVLAAHFPVEEIADDFRPWPNGLVSQVNHNAVLDLAIAEYVRVVVCLGGCSLDFLTRVTQRQGARGRRAQRLSLSIIDS